MSTSETKLCPFCGEEIKAIAVRCKHCHATLDSSGTHSGAASPLGPRTPDPGPRLQGTLAVGQVIGAGRFELKKLLGTGGMGEVYLAEHQYTGQNVAIKAVWPNLMGEQNARARFLQEGRTLGGLKHSNIVGLQDFFEEGGRFFLVMEYIEGVTLDAMLRHKREKSALLEINGVVRILTGVLEALAHAHGQTPAVVHRDIKPSNVMQGKDGRVVLMDFGIAKVIGGEKLTRTRGVVGTYEYMSPEQVQGSEITPAADVYAVGIMAFEMLTGRVPFPQKTDSGMDAMRGHVELPVPDVRSLRPDCPEWLANLVARALAKRPQERYANAGGMLDVVCPHDQSPVFSGNRIAVGEAREDARVLPTKSVRSTSVPSLVMLKIPSGTFLMGSPPTEADRSDDELQHQVTLSKSFLLGRTPVTLAQWRTVMGTNPSRFQGDSRADCPVENVSWFDAIEFCNGLSDADGLERCYDARPAFRYSVEVTWKMEANGYRLPTEAEWEYACRAGTTAARYGPLDEVAWYEGNSGGQPHSVGQKRPNALGLHDMLGNMCEWVWDWYGVYPSEAATDPTGPRSGAFRVNRGGSWFSGAWWMCAAYRLGFVPAFRSGLLGFRPCRSRY
jgi:serine/threonine protein kinase